jgi:hypothetical protein
MEEQQTVEPSARLMEILQELEDATKEQASALKVAFDQVQRTTVIQNKALDMMRSMIMERESEASGTYGCVNRIAAKVAAMQRYMPQEVQEKIENIAAQLEQLAQQDD